MIKEKIVALKRSKIYQNKFLFYSICLISLGIIFGLIYYLCLSSSIKTDFTYTLNNLTDFRCNTILKDLIILSVMLLTSFFIVGGIWPFLYLFYEGLTIGFIITLFTANFFIGGLIFSLIYVILFKAPLLFLFMIYSKKMTNNVIYVLKLIFKINITSNKNRLINNFKNSLYLIGIILVISTISYYISGYILSAFQFLIK